MSLPTTQAARDQIKGNAVIAMMAAGVATVPLAELADEDGTPRWDFIQQANRTFDKAEAENAGKPAYQPYPAGAHRHLGLIAEAVLAEARRCTRRSPPPSPAVEPVADLCELPAESDSRLVLAGAPFFPGLAGGVVDPGQGDAAVAC